MQRAARKRRQRPHHEVGAQPHEPVVEFAGGHVGPDRHALDHGDGARIEPLLHAHHGDARLGVARHDGALDRGGAAPAREKRSMEVEAAERRLAEDAARQDHAVGDDDGDVGIVRPEELGGLLAPQALGVSTGRPNRCAMRCTGEGFSSMPRPAAAGARV